MQQQSICLLHKKKMIRSHFCFDAVVAVVALLLFSDVALAQKAIVHTNYGDIDFHLLHEDAPRTVINFIQLARSGFYNHTYFYRLELGFVLQGGGYYNNQTSNNTVPLEYKVPNSNWTVGLARGDTPNSGSSEYFINIGNNSAALAPGGSSKHGYCVFALVSGGFDVVQKLTTLPTHFSNADGMTEFNKPWPLVTSIEIVYV